MRIRINLHYHETVMPVILSLLITSTFTSTAWQSAPSIQARAKQMSLHMEHKGLIHAWEILLPILKKNQNAFNSKYNTASNGSFHRFSPFIFSVLSNGKQNNTQKKICQMRSHFKVCGKANLKGCKDEPSISGFCLSRGGILERLYHSLFKLYLQNTDS